MWTWGDFDTRLQKKFSGSPLFIICDSLYMVAGLEFVRDTPYIKISLQVGEVIAPQFCFESGFPIRDPSEVDTMITNNTGTIDMSQVVSRTAYSFM